MVGHHDASAEIQAEIRLLQLERTLIATLFSPFELILANIEAKLRTNGKEESCALGEVKVQTSVDWYLYSLLSEGLVIDLDFTLVV